jgi:hypothetical protein
MFRGHLVQSRLTEPTWNPQFYEQSPDAATNPKIVDNTGACDAFLGGVAIGFLKTRKILEGSQYGSVAASFALEQIALPVLQNEGKGLEVWNGERYRPDYNISRRGSGIEGLGDRRYDNITYSVAGANA